MPSALIPTSNVNVATVLTVYGIETYLHVFLCVNEDYVATVLTVYGIETVKIKNKFTSII